MSDTIRFEDPVGQGRPVELEVFTVPKDLPDYDARMEKIPSPDPYYIDLGMLYQLALVEEVRRKDVIHAPIHVALRGHMGTGKDHDLEQFAAMLQLPYFRIPLTGEVRDITLIGSTKLHGDGKGGTESRWEDGDITRALRGPALINMSELNAAGAETLFALHALLDRYQALDLPTGETVRLREDTRVYGTMNPTDLRDYAGTQTLNKAFADRWVIWEKRFPQVEQIEAMLRMRYPTLKEPFVTTIARLTTEVNESFTAADARTRVGTPMSLRSVLDRLPAGLWMYADTDDPLRKSWESLVLSHIDAFDADHYETVWSAVARRGPEGPPFGD